MNRKNHDYKFRVLPEGPLEEDTFEQKIHEKVSDQLLDVISSSEKGITIGLEGPWGAGKSTVVSIFRQRLDDKTLFFDFDAWAHEGDPLRRAFLEGLLQKAEPKNNNKYIEKIKNEISGKTKTVEITTQGKSSKLGAKLGFSALFVPVGAAILSAVNFEKITTPWNHSAGTISWSLLFGIGLALAPVFVIIYWAIFGENAESEDGKKPSKDWSVLHEKSTQNYKQDISEETEKTSIEFEGYFHLILDYFVGKNKKFNRAIIVIDNLDRVENQTAKRIWSTLQTFFQHKNQANNEGQNSTWFIIPYDKEGLSSIWNGKNNTNTNSVYNSFIEKSIQITLDVPTPVFSVWSDYLNKIINQSLSGWPRDERAQVTSTILRYLSPITKTPTPRYLRRIINQIGALGVRWRNTVSAESKTLYALIKTEHTNDQIQKIIIDQNLPHGYQCRDNQETTMKHLAGMLFGVLPDFGIELLLENEIKEALYKGYSGRIKEISKKYKGAFISVCDSVLKEKTPSNSHTDEYWLNFSQAVVEIFNFDPKVFGPDIDRFIESWMFYDKYDFKKHTYSIAIDSIAKVTDSDIAYRHLLKDVFFPHIDDLLSHIIDNDFNERTALNLSIFYNHLIMHIPPANVKHYPELDTLTWNKWLEVCKRRNIQIDFIRPDKNMITTMAGTFNLSSPDIKALSILNNSLPLLKDMEGWGAIKKLLLNWLTPPQRSIASHNDAATSSTIFNLLCSMVVYFEDVDKDLESVLTDPNFVNVFSRLPSIRTSSALFALSALVFKQDIQNIPTIQLVKDFWLGKNETGYANVVKILEHLNATYIFNELSLDARNEVAIKYLNEHSQLEFAHDKYVS